MDYELLTKILTDYARKRWGGLKTPTEDLVQETLINIWNREDKIKNLPYWDSHCCRTLDYVAHTKLVEEHKNGLWIQQSNNIISDDFHEKDGDLYSVFDENLIYLIDPWLIEWKEYNKKRHHDYYQAHKEEVKAKSRAYYQAHKEERLEYTKQYQKEYRKTHQQQIKEYRETHKDYLKELARKSYYRHLDEYRAKSREYSREYGSKHREEYRERNRNRYKRLKELQADIQEQYGIKLKVKVVSDLMVAQNKSQEEYESLLQDCLNGLVVVDYSKYKDLEKHRQDEKKYYQAHREEILERNKQYKSEHIEQYREYGNNRYTKIKELRLEIQEQYGIKLKAKTVGKLLTAKNKSPETFNQLLQEYMAGQK